MVVTMTSSGLTASHISSKSVKQGTCKSNFRQNPFILPGSMSKRPANSWSPFSFSERRRTLRKALARELAPAKAILAMIRISFLYSCPGQAGTVSVIP